MERPRFTKKNKEDDDDDFECTIWDYCPRLNRFERCMLWIGSYCVIAVIHILYFIGRTFLAPELRLTTLQYTAMLLGVEVMAIFWPICDAVVLSWYFFGGYLCTLMSMPECCCRPPTGTLFEYIFSK